MTIAAFNDSVERSRAAYDAENHCARCAAILPPNPRRRRSLCGSCGQSDGPISRNGMLIRPAWGRRGAGLARPDRSQVEPVTTEPPESNTAALSSGNTSSDSNESDDSIALPGGRWVVRRGIRIWTPLPRANVSTTEPVDDPVTNPKPMCSTATRTRQQSAPEALHRQPGPSRPIGHDRLMSTVPARIDAPEAPCPSCGLPGEGAVHQVDEQIREADYLDAAGHIWRTKWIEVPA